MFFLVKEDILMTQKCFTAVSTNYLAHVPRRQKHHNLDTTRLTEYIYATRENNYGRENYCDGKIFFLYYLQCFNAQFPHDIEF